jgi:hypothetical protein
MYTTLAFDVLGEAKPGLGTFVQSGRNPPFRVEKSGSKSRHRFSHETFISLDNRRQYPPIVGQLPQDEDYNNPGRALAQSRYAGPKRGKEGKVCKRGCGASDPENIAIVNMYKKDGMSFEQIKNKLNADRVKTIKWY